MIYCKLYKNKCSVKETNAYDYPTVCDLCNSGKGTSYKEYYREISVNCCTCSKCTGLPDIEDYYKV